MSAPFFRLLAAEDKEGALVSAVDAYRKGEKSEVLFEVDPEDFRKVPNSPFAYWVDNEIRELFQKLPPFESEGRTVKQGLSTADNFRFVRLWWEVAAERRLDAANGPDWRKDLEGFQAWCRKRTREGKYWVPIAKGGEYSPYFSDIHLVVNWKNEGEELDAFPGAVIRNPGYYFRPGITWPKVTISGLSTRPLHAGCIFADGSISAFSEPNDLERLLCYLNTPFIEICMRTMGAWHNWEAATMSRVPVPPASAADGSFCHGFACRCVEACGRWFADAETDLQIHWAEHLRSPVISPSELRAFIKMNSVDHYRKLGLSLPVSPDLLLSWLNTEARYEPDFGNSQKVPKPQENFSKLLGMVFGRWDIRPRANHSEPYKIAGLFDPVSLCPSSTLVDRRNLPAGSGSIASEAWIAARVETSSIPSAGSVARPTIPDSEYPLVVPWNGILVDDPDHPDDIILRMRKALEAVWGEKAFTVEHELCEALEVKDLRAYLRKPSGFFQDHLDKYSKSRRKAPIYWPLSTRSGSYTLWIYYPRLTEGTLYECVTNYIDRKLEEVRRELAGIDRRLKEQIAPELRDSKEELSGLEEGLAEMREEIMRIVGLPYKPDLDDGVVICATPLFKLFRLPKWQKELQTSWDKLEKGEYDWAHLALAIWPNRVREKCRTDRSLAIAHGLEELCTKRPALKSRPDVVEPELNDADGDEEEE